MTILNHEDLAFKTALACLFGGTALIALALTTAHQATAQDLDMDQIFRCNPTDDVGPEQCAEARGLIMDNCTTCHSFVPIVLQQFDQAGWKGLMDRHESRAVQLSSDELDMVSAYLGANFNQDYDPPELPPRLLEQWTSY